MLCDIPFSFVIHVVCFLHPRDRPNTCTPVFEKKLFQTKLFSLPFWFSYKITFCLLLSTCSRQIRIIRCFYRKCTCHRMHCTLWMFFLASGLSQFQLELEINADNTKHWMKNDYSISSSHTQCLAQMFFVEDRSKSWETFRPVFTSWTAIMWSCSTDPARHPWLFSVKFHTFGIQTIPTNVLNLTVFRYFSVLFGVRETNDTPQLHLGEGYIWRIQTFNFETMVLIP